jgi:hypothetical protein
MTKLVSMLHMGPLRAGDYQMDFCSLEPDAPRKHRVWRGDERGRRRVIGYLLDWTDYDPPKLMPKDPVLGYVATPTPAENGPPTYGYIRLGPKEEEIESEDVFRSRVNALKELIGEPLEEIDGGY